MMKAPGSEFFRTTACGRSDAMAAAPVGPSRPSPEARRRWFLREFCVTTLDDEELTVAEPCPAFHEWAWHSAGGMPWRWIASCSDAGGRMRRPTSKQISRISLGFRLCTLNCRHKSSDEADPSFSDGSSQPQREPTDDSMQASPRGEDGGQARHSHAEPELDIVTSEDSERRWERLHHVDTSSNDTDSSLSTPRAEPNRPPEVGQFFTAEEFERIASGAQRGLLLAYEQSRLERLGCHPRSNKQELVRLQRQLRIEAPSESLQWMLPTMHHRTQVTMQADFDELQACLQRTGHGWRE